MDLSKKFLAEFFGTFWLVFGGCGSAVLAAKYLTPDGVQLGIGFVGVALAVGLTVLTMAYAIGHISGCHLNPAVSFGLLFAGRMPFKDLIPYILAQVLGGAVGAGFLYFIASGSGNSGFDLKNGFACNGFDEHSPGGYTMIPCAVAEALLTFFFLMIILGATDAKAPAGFAPIAIGLGLTLIHLIGIPITNLSVNPARSTGPALIMKFQGSIDWPVKQLWLFWAAPIGGAIVAGIVHRLFASESKN
jgi:aquaporin Z